jgi:hypothetical protein
MRWEVIRGPVARLFGLAGVLVLATTLVARGDDAKKKADAPKKERTAPADVQDIEDLLKQFAGGGDDDVIDQVRKQMEQVRERLRQMQRGGLMPVPGFPGGNVFGREARTPSAQQARLGAEVRKPSATLVDQLDLPKDQGMVLQEVGPNSPVAKAGMKAHDVLLEIDGKPVPSKGEEFDRLLEGIAANRKVAAVVMRKGKKETVKELTLPEAKAVAQRGPAAGGFPGARFGGRLIMPNLGGLGGATTITRTNDGFTTRHRADGATITVKGTVDQGKARVSEVTIQSAGQTKTYDSVDKVPQEHQEMVKKLAEMSARGGVFRLR